MARDIYKNEEYFTQYIEDEKRVYELFCKEYPNRNHDSRYYNIAKAMYSRGDEDIELIKQYFIQYLNQWKNDFRIECYNDNAENLALMVICDMNTSWVFNKLNETNREADDLFYDDWLLHYLASKGKEKDCFERLTSEEAKFEDLKLFAQTKESEYFKKYLKGWYNKSRRCAWWADHKIPDDRLLYNGYWNFEGAAVLKILNYNKDEFKDYKYFPYDLI